MFPATGTRARSPLLGPSGSVALVPGTAVAFDQRDRGGRTPCAGGVGLRLLPVFGPGVEDRVSPGPRGLDFVAAHEQCLVATDYVHDQPLVGVRRTADEALRERHVERDLAQADASRTRIL